LYFLLDGHEEFSGVRGGGFWVSGVGFVSEVAVVAGEGEGVGLLLKVFNFVSEKVQLLLDDVVLLQGFGGVRAGVSALLVIVVEDDHVEIGGFHLLEFE
jgi:hypothetical protein